VEGSTLLLGGEAMKITRLASCLLAFAVLALPVFSPRDIETPVPGVNRDIETPVPGDIETPVPGDIETPVPRATAAF
jgi:hypothetical protein